MGSRRSSAASSSTINTTHGRVAHLQRWPDGLHAALEAKERLAASTPGVVLDQITIQDPLLGYKHIAGMSGTVCTVAEEFIELYRLPAGRVERHVANRRIDLSATITLTEHDKLDAILAEVKARHGAGQPVLVGTQSVAESETLAGDTKEATIIAHA